MTPEPLRVSLHDRTGDVVIWTRGSPTVRREGRWIHGGAAMRYLPDADELKDFWTPVEGEQAAALIAEAGLTDLGSETTSDPDDITLSSLVEGLRRANLRRNQG